MTSDNYTGLAFRTDVPEARREKPPDPKNPRPNGFYWVKYGRKWTVCEWNLDHDGMGWSLIGWEYYAQDDEFDEIGPMIRPPSAKESE